MQAGAADASCMALYKDSLVANLSSLQEQANPDLNKTDIFLGADQAIAVSFSIELPIDIQNQRACALPNKTFVGTVCLIAKQ